MPTDSTAPFTVTTKPAHAWCDASTVRFMYMEHIPHRCVASSMQLFHFHERNTAEFRSPIPADSFVNPEAAPTDTVRRVRPGDLLAVGDAVFEVYVPEGMGPIYPYLRRVPAR